MSIAEAVHAPRVHHQWLPDKFQLEPGFSPDTIALLKAMGQNVEQGKTMGSVQSIMYKDGVFYGVSDPRRPGAGSPGAGRRTAHPLRPAPDRGLPGTDPPSRRRDLVGTGPD